MPDVCTERPRSAVSCGCPLASLTLGFERRANCIVRKRGVLTSAVNEVLAECRVVSLSFAVRSLWASLRRLTIQLCLTYRTRLCFALTVSVLVKASSTRARDAAPVFRAKQSPSGSAFAVVSTVGKVDAPLTVTFHLLDSFTVCLQDVFTCPVSVSRV